MKKALFSLQEKLIKFEKLLLISILCIMVFLSFLQFVLRFFFNFGILWMDIFLRYLVLNTAMFSVAYVSSTTGHFALEFFSKKLPPKAVKAAFIFSNFFAFLALIALFFSSVLFVRQEYLSSSIAFSAFEFEFKSFYFQLCLPVGFLFSCYHFLLKTIYPNFWNQLK